MSEELKPCPRCGATRGLYVLYDEHDMEWFVFCDGCKTSLHNEYNDTREEAVRIWNRRAERTWHDFSDELPPAGVSVLCRGKNGALYVGKPVTFKGNGTRKVWVPRGDRYRTPEKWMEIEDAD